ncbi:peptidase S8 [Micractinium conductrix]|uniref:Peptidase S8 n=1 Tax=Micractinium conductrix TaxID=554055 RepID=A0A2P6VJ73_9CHLO|nr:peptidase S8 [Micractinium conductrix]|eukprot:PSC74151.1 peptidase S8 [Micractinium conductrix]
MRIDRAASGAAVVAAPGRAPSDTVPADATMVFTITDSDSVEAKLKALKSNPAVAAAEPDYARSLSRQPNDPQFPSGPRAAGMWFLRSIAAPAAWDVTTGSLVDACCAPCHHTPT